MIEGAHGAEQAPPSAVAAALPEAAQAGVPTPARKPPRHRAAILAAVGGAALSLYLWLIATDGPSAAVLQTITDHLPESFRWLATLRGLRGWANPQGADGYNGWFWFYNSAVPEGGWGWWIVWLVGGAAVLAVILEPSWRARSRPSRGQAALAVAWLVVVAYQLQIGAIRLKRPDATDRIVGLIMHNGFTGYFDTARTHRHFDDLLAAYDGEGAARRGDGHAATHPPGSVIFLWLPMVAVTSLPYQYSRKLMNFTAEALHIRASGMNLAGILDALLSGELILLLTALVVLPLYGCAKLIAGDRWAIPLAGLGVLCPAVLIHTPFLDCMYPTLALSIMLLVLKVSRDWTRPVFRGALAGMLASLATMMSYGLAALAVPFAMVLATSVLSGGQGLMSSEIETPRQQRVTAACWFVGTLLLVLIRGEAEHLTVARLLSEPDGLRSRNGRSDRCGVFGDALAPE